MYQSKTTVSILKKGLIYRQFNFLMTAFEPHIYTLIHFGKVEKIFFFAKLKVMSETPEVSVRTPTLVVGFDPGDKNGAVEISSGQKHLIGQEEAYQLGERLSLVLPRESDYPLTTFFSDLISVSSGGETSSKLGSVLGKLERGDQEDVIRLFGNVNLLACDLLDAVDLQGEVSEAISREEEQESKIILASFNQRLSYALDSASDLPIDDPDRRHVESFVAFLEVISKSHHNSGSREIIRDLISSARAQAALCNLLEQEGWMVIVPNWEDEEEIAKFDLRGVDLVAVSPEGRMAFIDVKSRMYTEEHKERAMIGIEEVEGGQIEDLRAIVIKFLKSYEGSSFQDHCERAVKRDGRIARCRVLMPASPLIIGQLGRIEKEHYRFISTAVKKGILRLCQ